MKQTFAIGPDILLSIWLPPEGVTHIWAGFPPPQVACSGKFLTVRSTVCFSVGPDPVKLTAKVNHHGFMNQISENQNASPGTDYCFHYRYYYHHYSLF